MFTARLKVKPSNQIRLHRLIIAKNEALALQLIDMMPVEWISHSINNFDGMNVCYASPRIGLIQPSFLTVATEILKQKQIAKSPHPLEINGNMQDALQLAATYGLEQVVRKLLDMGADPNYRDGFGRTSLYYAAGWRHNVIIELLISRGARIDLRDSVLSTPFNAYLMSSNQPYSFSDEIISKLKIDYLSQHRVGNGKLQSEVMVGNSREYYLQRFDESMDRLKTEGDENSKNFGYEFYQSRRERREPEKSQEFNFSRRTLVIMLKVANVVLQLPSEYHEEVIRNKKVLMLFQFFGSLIGCLAKEVKRSYQDKIPWESLSFFACFFEEERIFNDQEIINGLKLLIKDTCPIIKREFTLIINGSSEWLSRNSELVYVPPYRDPEFLALYNFTDYFHDLKTIEKLLKHLETADSLDPNSLYGRFGLLQIIKTVADLSKYQHAGRHLTRTIKEKLPFFPWNEFGELRDKLAKISLFQENIDFTQDLLENNTPFFIDLKGELALLRAELVVINAELRTLKYIELGNYYKNEPKSAEQAKRDMRLFTKLSGQGVSRLIELINNIKVSKTESRVAQVKKFDEQIIGIEAKVKSAEKKEQLKQEVSSSINRIQKEIDEINLGFDNISREISNAGFITLEQRRFLLSQCSSLHCDVVKRNISEHSNFKRILELEYKLHLKSDEAFSELSTDEKLAIINRTERYLQDLAKLVIPDDEVREQLYGNSDIFEPGYDEFGGYLIRQYERISADGNQLYAARFLAVEVQQSLRFIGLGGNQAFRVHLEHNEPVYDSIAPNRLREDLDEILKNITRDFPAIVALREEIVSKNLLSV